MITVITGVPGAGKTAYCVEKLLLPMAGKLETAIDPDGKEIKYERKIYTNINGLLLDHELINAEHLNTWQDWVKPGDLIVYDEVQKPWPKVAMGSKKPPCIEALETHRHMGVDFILLTQHPNLCHVALAELAGRHLHVRKLGNSRFATVYEWDGMSRTLLYKNSMAKSPWRRSKKAEQAYKSSSLHTKQKRATPTLVYAIIGATIAMAALGPYAWGRIGERLNPQPLNLAKAAPAKPPAKPASAPATPLTPMGPPTPLPSPVEAVAAVPRLAGCAAMAGKCTCFGVDGTVLPTEPEMCKTTVGSHLPSVAVLPSSLVDQKTPKAPGAYAGWVPGPAPKGSTAADVVAVYR